MKIKNKSLLHDAVKIDVKEPINAEPNRINIYTCEKCHGKTVTIDIHVGVTPFMLDCDGTACSGFYRKHLISPVPQWEWFKPVGSEYRKLNRAMREHVDKGGLDIRKRR